MKRVFIAFFFFTAGLLLCGQEDPFYNGSLGNRYYPMYNPGGFGQLSAPINLETEKKSNVGVQLGTSFSTDFKGGFAFTTMAAPELRYNVNKRFRIRGGISISNTEYGNTVVYSPFGAGRYSGNVTQGTIYVSGDYMISPRVILSGTAYKEFSINNDNPDNAYRPGYDGKGLMMNLRLFPSDNVQIDVGAEIYQGNNPWRGGTYNPYYGPFSRPSW